MANLMRKTKDQLIDLARKAKLTIKPDAQKAEIVEALQHESDGVTKPPMLGDDVKATRIKKTLKGREVKAAKDRKALEKRMAKRGSYVGSPK